MTRKKAQAVRGDLGKIQFRRLNPKVHMGTATGRYAGWIGQMNLSINKRAGGNPPLIARRLAEKFLKKEPAGRKAGKAKVSASQPDFIRSSAQAKFSRISSGMGRS